MQSNFNTTVVGKPYKRINKITIDYPAPMTANVTFWDQDFVPLVDGDHRAVGQERVISFTVLPERMGDALPLSDVLTGELPGADTTYEQVMIGIMAALRAHQ